MVETDIDKGMRLMDVKGHIRFSIKADDTEENQMVHDAFREFCRLETDNNYTQGIRKLLEYMERDWKLETIHNKIEELEGRIVALEKTPEEKEEVF